MTVTLDNYSYSLDPSSITLPNNDEVSDLAPSHTLDFTSRIIGIEATFSFDDNLGISGVHPEFSRGIRVLKELKIMTD